MPEEATTEQIPSSRNHLSPQSVAPGIAYLTIGFVNVYFVSEPGSGSWTLVDTGLPFTAPFLRHTAEMLYGEGARPDAIILTHGHFDHAGNALELAREWNIPVYAHRLEMPYLTGRSDYAPKDPTPGGAICFMSRLFPTNGFDLGEVVQTLPDDGSVPTLPGWRWFHTPGHTAGHISLFRESDRTLLAGDAFATMDMDSWASHVTEAQEVARPAVPFTPDWGAARSSVRLLADLKPNVIGAGHGIPMSGQEAQAQLQHLAAHLIPPPTGRYTLQPARADETGLVAVPPPVPDPLPGKLALGAALFAGAAAIVGLAAWQTRRSSGSELASA